MSDISGGVVAALSDEDLDRMSAASEAASVVSTTMDPGATPAVVPRAEETSSDGYQALKGGACVEVRGEKFFLAEKVPGVVLLDLALTGDPSAEDFERVRGIKGFIDLVIVEEQRPAWKAMLYRSRKSVV